MDEFLLGASVVLFLLSLILPIVLFVLIYSTRKRLRNVEQSLEKRERELRYLYDRVDSERSATDLEILKRKKALAAKIEKVDEPIGPAIPVVDVPTLDERTQPQREVIDDSPTAPSAPATERPPPPKPAPKPEPVDEAPPPPRVPLEQRIATIFTRVGAGALLLGLLYFFKYAVDSEWIGPMGRVLVGVGVGVAILGFAEAARARTRAGYIHALIGVGLACLYISAYASSAFYQLVPTEIAFAANAVILLLGALLAWRHQGEPILVLVLIAGFLNPVLLSTGVDRPFALFFYLFAMTSVVLVVATGGGMKVAVTLSIIGVGVLFGGWYDKFFDAHDARGFGDQPPESLVGPYFALSARTVPLGAVIVFTVQWIAVAFRLRQLEKLPRLVVPITVAALVLAHGGLTALLFDHPIPLGVAVIILGGGSVLVMRALGATRFLLIPMLFAFLLLLGLAEGSRDWNHNAVVALLGLWTAVYVAAFLYEIGSGELTTGQAVRASVALFSFAILASSLLLPNEKPIGAELALLGATVATSFIGHRARLPWIPLTGLLITLIPMSVAVYQAGEAAGHWDPIAVGIGFLWSASLAVSPIITALSTEEPKRLHLFNLALSSLAFVALVLVGTSEDSPTLRAVLTGFAGAIDLAFATALAMKKRSATWTAVLAALSVGLFAPAVAFAFSGATITVLWAVLTGVSAAIVAHSKDRVWLATLGLLATATLFRLFAIDVSEAQGVLDEFEWSQGRSGVLELPAFLNFRSYAFFGTGLSFLGGALLIGRAGATGALKIVAGGLAVVAYTLITAILVVEVRAALLVLPPLPPILLDIEEFSVFMDSVRAAKMEQHNLLAMASTVVLAVVAAALLSIGFLAKDPFHRYLGLVVFVATTLKLVGWDVWNLARIYQVVALTVVGALLLGSGFLYARLKGLFKSTAAALLILGSSVAEAQDAPLTGAVEVHRFSHRRSIGSVTAPSDYIFSIDPDLYRTSTGRALFEDIRIADDRGHEVPYVVRLAAPVEEVRFEHLRMFDPGELDGGAFRATFEVPSSLEHCEIRLELAGAAPYLRRTKIETGDSTDDMQVVSEGALIWALTTNTRSDIQYPRSIARYLRMTLQPDPDATTTRILGATAGCDGPKSAPPEERIPLVVVKVERNGETKSTNVDLDVGSGGTPVETIWLEIGTAEFSRRASLSASSYEKVWPVIGGGVLYRYAGSGRPSNLSIAAGGARKRYFRVTIEDGDNAPLEITKAAASIRIRQVIFRAARSGAHMLYVGSDNAQEPYYDLKEILERGTPEPPRPATLGAVEPNPDFGRPKVDDDLPATERHRTTIGVVLGVVLVALAAWAVRLIRGTPGSGPA